MRPERRWTDDDPRFKELVLYVCERSANDPKFGATKLNKILYFADFLAYAELGAPITGFEYQKLPNGPAPRRLLPVRGEMIEDHSLAIQPVKLVSGRIQERPVNLRSAQLSLFTPEQIALVDAIIEALRDATRKAAEAAAMVSLGATASARDAQDPEPALVLLHVRAHA